MYVPRMLIRLWMRLEFGVRGVNSDLQNRVN